MTDYTALDAAVAKIRPKNPGIAACFDEVEKILKTLSSPSPPPSPSLPFTLGQKLWTGAKSSDWYSPSTSATGNYGGGWYNSGGGTNTDLPSGVQATILDGQSPTSGVRGFRWAESNTHPQFYAEATYVLNPVTVTNWLQIQEVKSKTQDGSRTDPFWYVTLVNTTGGLVPHLTWWPTFASLGVIGPHAGEGPAGEDYVTTGLLPVGVPFRLGMAVKQSSGFDGRIVLVQDGRVILDEPGVKTGYPNTTLTPGTNDQWACTLYGSGFTPSPLTSLVQSASVWAVSGL